MTSKTCTSCHATKPLTSFYERIDNRLGVTAKCKECTKEYRRQYYLDNLDKEKAQMKKRNGAAKVRRRQAKKDAVILAEIETRAAELFRERFPHEWNAIIREVESNQFLS